LSYVDVIRDVRSIEDEIHNCQAVIDSLSLDVLNTSLSHITGQDVIAGDRTAIGDLLEVFSGLMEFILEDITSAASTDGAAPSDLDGLFLYGFCVSLSLRLAVEHIASLDRRLTIRSFCSFILPMNSAWFCTYLFPSSISCF
jgi:Domain of unknown function (DUF5745)